MYLHLCGTLIMTEQVVRLTFGFLGVGLESLPLGAFVKVGRVPVPSLAEVAAVVLSWTVPSC